MNTNTKYIIEDLIHDLMPIFILVLLFIGVTYMAYYFDKNISCPKTANIMEMEYRYDFWAGGCFIKADNAQWIGINYYHEVKIDK